MRTSVLVKKATISLDIWAMWFKRAFVSRHMANPKTSLEE